MILLTTCRILPGLILACALCLGTCRVSAQSEPAVQGIRVPYGMSWGDTPEKVRDMIAGVKARELSFMNKGSGKEVMEAEGLALGEPLLRKTLFTFRDGSLVEIEMQYGNPSWDADKTLDFFDRTRRNINGRYGVGTLLVNRVKERPAGEKVPEDMNYTLIVYEWSQPAVTLELDYYGVEKSDQTLRMVSLHYKKP
jgi:hypothetical protein